MKINQEKKDNNGSSSDRIAYLDSMRAIAIIMVVGVHSFGYCLPLPDNQHHLISFIVHTISVPVFFLVDGYLFGRSVTLLGSYNYRKYVKSSVYRLIGPWVIFTLFYTFTRYIFELTGFLSEKTIIGHPWQKVLISSYGSVYAPQMYFLFSLFLIRLCSPIFKKIFFKKKLGVTVLLFLGYLITYKALVPYINPFLAIENGQEPILHALWGIQFYLAGTILFIASEVIDIKKLFFPFFILFVSFLMIKNIFSVDYLGDLIQYLYLLSFFLLFIFFQKENSLLSLIGKNTMGIYLIHAPILLKGVSLILNRFLSIPVMSYLSILFLTTFLCICIVSIIKSIPYGALLFGMSYHHK